MVSELDQILYMGWISDDGRMQYTPVIDFFEAEGRELLSWSHEAGVFWWEKEDRKVYYLPPMRHIWRGTTSLWVKRYQEQIDAVMVEIEYMNSDEEKGW